MKAFLFMLIEVLVIADWTFECFITTYYWVINWLTNEVEQSLAISFCVIYNKIIFWELLSFQDQHMRSSNYK